MIRTTIKILLILFSFNSYSQPNIEKIEIYNSVLDNFAKSSSLETKMLLIDSTCEANYHNEIEDTILQKYFLIRKYDLESKIKLRRNFIDNSKFKEIISFSNLNINKFIIFKQDSLNKIFQTCNDTLGYDLDEKCWSFIHDTLKFNGFCKFSNPYFYNDKTVLIYFYHLLGPLAGVGYVYVLIKVDGKWKIVSKIWQWIS
jgi:hypothetical protein